MRRFGHLYWSLAPKAIVATVVLVAIAMSCSSGPSPTATPEPTPTRTPSEVRATLRQLAPGFDDLPSGYAEVSDSRLFLTNEEAVRGRPDEEAELRELEKFGRILGYQVGHEKGSAALFSTIELYRDAEGASDSFESVPPGYSTIEEALEAEFLRVLPNADELGADVSVSITRISMPRIGQTTTAWKLVVSVRTQDLTMYGACSHQGQVQACVIGVDADIAGILDGTASGEEILADIEYVLERVIGKARALR